MNSEIYNNINDLFNQWLKAIRFDSTGTVGLKERKKLIDYCLLNKEEFKRWMIDMLSNPDEFNYCIPSICEIIFPDIANKISSKIPEEDTKKFLDELNNCKNSEKLLDFDFSIFSNNIYSECNIWLNYFKGTKNIDYYKDYNEYKNYLNKHYISWNPFHEDDPNPTYNEFINNKSKYII